MGSPGGLRAMGALMEEPPSLPRTPSISPPIDGPILNPLATRAAATNVPANTDGGLRASYSLAPPGFNFAAVGSMSSETTTPFLLEAASAPHVVSVWDPPSMMPVPSGKADECAEIALALQAVMQNKPHLRVAVKALERYEQFRLARAAMHVIGQELNIEEPLSKGGTFESIVQALSLNEEPAGMMVEFHVEGEHGQSGNWRRMAWQCALAMDVLFHSRQLSAGVLIEAHRMMMRGAHGAGEETGESFSPGLRTTDAYAGDYQFESPDHLQRSVEAMAQRFNDAVSNPRKHPVIVAIDLVYAFVTIHPFTNGNGRLCRMLFTYAMKKQGFPLLVFLQAPTGSKPAREHWLEAIRRAQQQVSSTSRHEMYGTGFLAVGMALKNAAIYFDGPTNSSWW